MNELADCDKALERRLAVIPGKEAFAAFNRDLQERFGVSITSTGTIDAMRAEDMPGEMNELISLIEEFSAHDPA